MNYVAYFTKFPHKNFIMNDYKLFSTVTVVSYKYSKQIFTDTRNFFFGNSNTGYALACF